MVAALVAAACGGSGTPGPTTVAGAGPTTTTTTAVARPRGGGPPRATAPATTSAPDDGGVTGAGGRPRFAFVLHADPAVGPQLRTRFERLVAFMDDLTARNAALPEGARHRVTIMFTGNWGLLMTKDADVRAAVASWVADGHEMAFHSHTHNHAFPDGYTNATDLGPDDWSVCAAGDDAAACTLDAAYAAVRDGVAAAVGEPVDIRFAGIGPTGNGGPDPVSDNDNRCAPDRDAAGRPLADEDHCFVREFTGLVAAEIEHIGSDHPGVTVEDTDDPAALADVTHCVPWGPGGRELYYVPFAPFETESGRLKVTLETTLAALEVGAPDEVVSVVIHPSSYDPSPSRTYDGDRRQRITELFDRLDAAGVASMTLSDIHDTDTGDAAARCG